MIVIWQAVIPPSFCAIALVIKYITLTQSQPVRGFSALYSACNAAIASPQLTHKPFGSKGETTSVEPRNSSYAGKAVCIIIIFYTVRLPHLGASVVGLYLTLEDRNNRMDLTETQEPPVTYVSTFNNMSLNGMGSPRQRYAFSVQLTDREQQC
jgi:hypothetical protein